MLQFKRLGFGKGKWNGSGGKVFSGETVEESVKREVKEETGIIVKSMKKTGELEFIFKNKKE